MLFTEMLKIQKIHLRSFLNGNDLWHNAMIVLHAYWSSSGPSPVSYFVFINTESKINKIFISIF